MAREGAPAFVGVVTPCCAVALGFTGFPSFESCNTAFCLAEVGWCCAVWPNPPQSLQLVPETARYPATLAAMLGHVLEG